MPNKIRLLVVEDSSYMLMAIRAMVRLDPGIEIVGEAEDGRQGVQMALELRPDVVTMDVNLPVLNGIEATRLIMAQAPTTIIMLSSMTERGLLATGEALGAGAIDYLPKTMSAIDVDLATIAQRLAEKIRFWGEGSGRLLRGSLACPPVPRDTSLILLAGGIGSPLVASYLLADLPALPCPAVVSLEILTPRNTAAYVEHLDRVTRWPVREAVHGRRLEAGTITVVPGGRRAALQERDGTVGLTLRPDAGADLFASAVRTLPRPQLVILSGGERDLGPLSSLVANAPTTFWTQARETCADPGLVAAFEAFGLPVLSLTPKANQAGGGSLRDAA